MSLRTPVESRCSSLPSAFMTYRSRNDCLIRGSSCWTVNAIRRPSGDHMGSERDAGTVRGTGTAGAAGRRRRP